MLTLTNKTNGASYKYEEGSIIIDGSYSLLEENKSFQNLNGQIRKAEFPIGSLNMMGDRVSINVKPEDLAEASVAVSGLIAAIKETING